MARCYLRPPNIMIILRKILKLLMFLILSQRLLFIFRQRVNNISAGMDYIVPEQEVNGKNMNIYQGEHLPDGKKNTIERLIRKLLCQISKNAHLRKKRENRPGRDL
jgi:hypothetical protein